MGPLVDTSVLVDFLRSVSNEETEVLARLLADGIAPATAPIVVQELLQGCRTAHDVDVAQQDLANFDQLPPPDYDIHRRAARLFREFRRGGVTSSTVDALIVATALHHRCDLLSRDAVQKKLADFAGVSLAEVGGW